MAWASARCKTQARHRFAAPRAAPHCVATHRSSRHRGPHPRPHTPPLSFWLTGGLCSPSPPFLAAPLFATHRPQRAAYIWGLIRGLTPRSYSLMPLTNPSINDTHR